MASVVVLDYGSGNLRSAQRAVARTGVDVTVTDDLAAAAAADGLVVPGVGAYAACMAGIEALGAGPVIAERVAAGRPVLGICVGMQILFDSGVEHGIETKGLGLLPGAVAALKTASDLCDNGGSMDPATLLADFAAVEIDLAPYLSKLKL